jgi:hypothetical protein
MRTLAKLLLINAAVFVGLVAVGAVVLLTLPRNVSEEFRFGRASLPNYAGVAWADRHFDELKEQERTYYSYIGWRRRPYSGETINIVGILGERLTARHPRPRPEQVYFFGGSAMWGTGSRDIDTIPSQFALRTGLQARNFGESAYTAHQSLEMMMRLLQGGERPAAVVFYDGVNDVAHKCRVELGPYSDAQEAKTRRLLEQRGARGALRATIERLSTLFAEDEIADKYDCDDNRVKAAAVADAMISDWRISAAVAALHGVRFYAALQPVLYFSRTRADHLSRENDAEREKQFRAVYPLLREAVARAGFLDFIDVFDRDEYIYIDFCHVSPNGNALVAARLAEAILPDLPPDGDAPAASAIAPRSPS